MGRGLSHVQHRALLLMLEGLEIWGVRSSWVVGSWSYVLLNPGDARVERLDCRTVRRLRRRGYIVNKIGRGSSRYPYRKEYGVTVRGRWAVFAKEVCCGRGGGDRNGGGAGVGSPRSGVS